MSARALAAALLLLAPAARAQEVPDDLAALLDANVVSGASRAAERSDDAPATITSVSAEDLRRYGLRSLDEAINFLSLGLTASQLQSEVEVGARGVLLTADYGNHLLVIVDGHPLNEPWDGTAYYNQALGVPLELIDRIELILGPGSVLYGSYAMLGVINVVTRRARDLGRLQLHAEGGLLPALDTSAAPRLQAEGLGWTGRLAALSGWEGALAGRRAELVLAFEYFQLQGPQLDLPLQSGITETDGSRTWPTDFGPLAPGPGTWGGKTSNWVTRLPTAVAKLRWGELDLWAKATLFHRSNPYVGAVGDFSSPDTYNQERWLDLALRWRGDLGERVQAEARATFDAYQWWESYRTARWFTDGVPGLDPAIDPETLRFDQEGFANTRRVGLEGRATIDWLGDGRFTLLAGVDARGARYDVRPRNASLSGLALPAAPPYARTEYVAAPYLQQRALLAKDLRLNLGLRLDVAPGGTRLSPRGAVVWTTPWEGRVKAVFSSAFRSPTGYERFAAYPDYALANPGLRPETVMTGELSYEQRLGRTRLLAGAFLSRYDDLIVFVPAPAELAPRGESWYLNSGSAVTNAGANLLAEGAAGRLRWGLGLTLARNWRDGEELPLRVAAPVFGNARVSWDLREDGPSLALAFFAAGSRRIDTADASVEDAAGNPVGWATTTAGPQAELRATFSVPRTPVAGLSWRVAVGGTLNAWMPYTLGPRQEPDLSAGALTPQLMPSPNRLYALATASWGLDALK